VFSSSAKHRRTEIQSQPADSSNVDDESSSGSDEPEFDSEDASPTAGGAITQKRKRSKLKVQSWPSILAAAIMIDTPAEYVAFQLILLFFLYLDIVLISDWWNK
jgi:hypothetical protein